MYPTERRAAILAAARAAGRRVAVSDLSRLLGVTPETIRRDLDFLEQEGLLRRQHGGAQLIRTAPFEQSLAVRQASEGPQKRCIARAVLELLPEDGVVLLDSGSLTLTLATLFPAGRDLLVVTNNLPAARVLSRHRSLTVLALPGRVRRLTQGAVDEWTRERLENLSVDLAVIGANGLTAAEGATTTSPAEAAVKRGMLETARTSVLAVAASKVGLVSFCGFAAPDDFDHVYTDSRIEATQLTELADAGANLTVATPEGGTE
ncbi:DeoR/GlpR transcriptional regulator [Leucobacter sp. CSA1]|uniref:Lactose phosphotransferase system repressor n=1 Tax=Leucobacter chromiisoli TaxID=2796471 RepID=A0A934Q500_9MICO|nr:DeoR/GlpR family DNA-binding transcription regulator [Leucobacter chromiisoli]MBK0418454.1 DeoR/GlpR transcriptional regulator [Leucobacter chromiisoli]